MVEQNKWSVKEFSKRPLCFTQQKKLQSTVCVQDLFHAALLFSDFLLIIQFSHLLYQKQCDRNNEAGWKWQFAVKAEEACWRIRWRYCQVMQKHVKLSTLRHLGLTHCWAWFHPSGSKYWKPESRLHLTSARGDHIEDGVTGCWWIYMQTWVNMRGPIQYRQRPLQTHEKLWTI